MLSGDYSQLLTKREEDTSNAGFKDWTFNTVHFWGTDTNGEFILLIDHNVRMVSKKIYIFKKYF